MLLAGWLLGAAAVAATSTPLQPSWEALWAGDLEAARRSFEMALSEDPELLEAVTGLGFVDLRKGELTRAAERFSNVLERVPGDRDASLGLALVEEARGATEAAALRLSSLRRDFPHDAEVLALHRRVARARPDLEALPSEPPAARHLAARPSHELDLPMRVVGRRFELRDSGGSYRPWFAKGINLGVALPGRFPSEFPLDAALYLEWLEVMKRAGFNAVRVYTILPPAFYDALAAFNHEREDPIFLIQGVWVELPPQDEFCDAGYTESFRGEIRRAVDVVHGAVDLPLRPGHAGGRYRSDVSRWWVATILGREWEPYAVQGHDERHAGALYDYPGRFVEARGVSATERWVAAQMDYAVAYGTDRWNAQRPVSFTNWPPLDPLHHPTESSTAEEAVWRARLGMPPRPPTGRDYDNDVAELDLEKMRATAANRGGLFAAYHIYPYYPDFLIYDRRYFEAHDAEGPNPYLGYLERLLAHHRSHPLLVAEVGVPSSREPAHVHPTGWHHGGLGEQEAGEVTARLLRAIHGSGAAGAVVFAWIDEWFKHTWITRPFHRPEERNRLWHDRRDPEQGFGLLAMRPGAGGPTVVIDGRVDDWRGVPPSLAAPEGEEAMVRSLSVQSDEGDLYLMVRLAPGPPPALAIGIDVVGPELGDVRFPAGLELESQVGFEAAVLFDGARAELVLARAYDPWSQRHSLIYPRATDAGDYVVPKSSPNRVRIARDGTVFPKVVLARGELRWGSTDRTRPEWHDQAEWYHDPSTGVFELRVPWGLLNVTDPSSRTVVFETPEGRQGTRETEGFRFAVAAFWPASGNQIRALDGRALEVLPRPGADGVVPPSPLFRWPTWESPTYHTSKKATFSIVAQTLEQIPDRPVETPSR